jgi:D-alanyl-D-alanine carboxypeptidase
VSSTHDLCRFGLAVRNGQIVSARSLAVMLDVKPTGVENKWIGHGVFKIDKGAENGGVWYGHTGGVLGYGSCLFWSEEKNVVIAALGNVGSSHAGRVVNGSWAFTDTDLPKLALRFAEGEK